jgi:hypothetical protein
VFSTEEVDVIVGDVLKAQRSAKQYRALSCVLIAALIAVTAAVFGAGSLAHVNGRTCWT